MYLLLSVGGPAVFLIFAIIILVMAICVFAVVFIKGIIQWRSNNKAPKITVRAKVATKRTRISHHHGAGTNEVVVHAARFTYYYITFEFESGDREEFAVTASDYGMIAEGDEGKLTFKGTRFLNFERGI